MSRTPVAAIAAILFVLFYMVAAVVLPDHLPALPWPVEAAYWCVAGLLWVLPVRWLMLWAAHKR